MIYSTYGYYYTYSVKRIDNPLMGIFELIVDFDILVQLF